ncbi:hypothetical protein Zmor_020300 [Zophobas morio]|uniref:Uncharacterized protein n=1 Tax=Zophobas morio TaxID=2755281 RepID=A0AA38MA61_9CUCU|nr:hypothetical protein Zmor_020300 [Zophobas morio]
MYKNPLEEENTRETSIQRLREFPYYLKENIEKNLTFCLTLLEDRPTQKTQQHLSLKEGEIYILNKIDNNNSRTVADLVFYFGNNKKKTMRQLLIESSTDVFYCFVQQFAKDDFSRGVMFGDSVKNKFGMRTGKTVKNDETEWKASSIYKKVGLFFDETNEFFGNQDTNSEKYGYRRIFAWENADTKAPRHRITIWRRNNCHSWLQTLKST